MACRPDKDLRLILVEGSPTQPDFLSPLPAGPPGFACDHGAVITSSPVCFPAVSRSGSLESRTNLAAPCCQPTLEGSPPPPAPAPSDLVPRPWGFVQSEPSPCPSQVALKFSFCQFNSVMDEEEQEKWPAQLASPLALAGNPGLAGDG